MFLTALFSSGQGDRKTQDQSLPVERTRLGWTPRPGKDPQEDRQEKLVTHLLIPQESALEDWMGHRWH